jgi:hypothetical protein
MLGAVGVIDALWQVEQAVGAVKPEPDSRQPGRHSSDPLHGKRFRKSAVAVLCGDIDRQPRPIHLRGPGAVHVDQPVGAG